MALIKCPECGNEVSDKAETCIHCGCPLKSEQTVTCTECGQEVSSKAETCPYCGGPITKKTTFAGSVIIQTSEAFIGLLGRYIIKDEKGNSLANLKAGETYQTQIFSDTVYYVRLKGAFGSFQKIVACADKENKFYVTSNGVGGFSVTQLN